MLVNHPNVAGWRAKGVHIVLSALYRLCSPFHLFKVNLDFPREGTGEIDE